MIDLNDYKNAVLHLMYHYYMDSCLKTDAGFKDLEEPETLEFLNYIQTVASKYKRMKQYNFTEH
jgi:hypothetical protein